MIGLILVLLAGVWVIFYRPINFSETNRLPAKITDKLDQLWGIAQNSLLERRYLRAEKALLTILRVDERNASAYNRLGILYAKQQQYRDAIECFEIAQSLEPSASSLHNVGLIYYETQNYEKAALAFEQALAMDSELPARYIAYAKVQEKMGHERKVIDSLEQAFRLDPSPQTMQLLIEAYDKAGETQLADRLRTKLGKIHTTQNQTPIKPEQPRRVIM